mmetsp:Transcript_11848/g.23980  ORF Transcript_11848/g.23980 Transcript_11848/m.23980 type:complete len:101 (+) Transcript_11848:317-619(+)
MQQTTNAHLFAESFLQAYFLRWSMREMTRCWGSRMARMVLSVWCSFIGSCATPRNSNKDKGGNIGNSSPYNAYTCTSGSSDGSSSGNTNARRRQCQNSDG